MSRGTGRAVAVALIALVSVSLVFGVAGCGETGSVAGTTAGTVDGRISHPSGPADVVLQVSVEGGFVPVSWSLTHVPEFTLYGDGTVIVTGPVIAIYPGPVLPNLQTTTITEETTQAILSAAREAGLFASDVDYGRPGITDVATTTITIYAGGTAYRSSIYALGMDEGAGGLTMEQQQARATIADLTGRLQDLTVFQPSQLQWTPYEYTSLAVFSTPADPTLVPDSSEIEPNRLAWPLGDLATLGAEVMPDGYRKAVLAGDDLAQLKPLLAEANQLTVWSSGDQEYNLYFRPHLPNETD